MKMIKTSDRSRYEGLKDQLYELYINGMDLREIAKKLNISITTAVLYRRKMVQELGALSTQHMEEIREEFLTKSMGQLHITRNKALSLINDSDPKVVLNACNCVVGSIRTEADILSRLSIIDNKYNQVITINSNEGLPTLSRLSELYQHNVVEHDNKKTIE